MSSSPATFPSPEEGLGLHLRLCELDPTATADVCAAYIQPLLDSLARRFPQVDEHLRTTAVQQAVFDYVQNHSAYDPTRGDLGLYLRMAARADLANLLRQEERHHRQRVAWAAVENALEDRNIEGGEGDPALLLERTEEAEQCRQVLHEVEQGLTSPEREALRLMLAGERTTTAYVGPLGLAELTPAEQEREVKRVKDRIKKRLEREGKRHG